MRKVFGSIGSVGLAGVTAFAASAVSVSAATFVPVYGTALNTGGDYVSATQTLQTAVTPAAGGFSSAFSTSTARKPSSGYTGPDFFGGYAVSSSGITLAGSTTQTQRVVNSGSADPISVQALSSSTAQAPAAGSTVSIAGAMLFDLGSSKGYANIQDINVTASPVANAVTNTTIAGSFTVLIGDGTNWYSSSTSKTSSGNINLTLSCATWNTYNTSTFSIGSSSTAPTSVRYIGYAFTGTTTSKSGASYTSNILAGTSLTSVSYDAVPEPAGLAAVGGLFALAIRRRRS